MSNHIIEKDNPKRWFLSQHGTGTDSLMVFGNAGPQGETQVETGESNTLSAYLTEDELEIAVDGIAGVNYYKDAVEEGSDKFQKPSEKYESPSEEEFNPPEPNSPEPPE